MPTIARNERLDAQLKELPDSPGVYLFHDRDGVVLYVGKAKSLRKRVQSYFRREAYATIKTAELVDRIEEIEFLGAGSEHEALLLEQNLIKRHRPPFNIRLRDDKSYPYIAVTTSDEYPRVMFTRERHRRGVLYFGPYSSAKKVRETLDVLNRVFPYRPCEGPQPGRRSGVPCLDHHIGRCAAPCVGLISKEDYAAVIDSVVEFLSGRVRPLERRLEQQMKDAAARHEFEEAARYRNRLTAVRHLSQRQVADHVGSQTGDVLAAAVSDTAANVQLFQLRDGRLADRRSFYLDNAGGERESEVLWGFALEYYGGQVAIPPSVIVPKGFEDADLLAMFLSDRRGSAVEVRVAQRGEKRRLVELAAGNAEMALEHDRAGGAANARPPGGGVGGAARAAQPGVVAGADRVLRHLQPGRVEHRRLDGGVRGRRRQARRLPQVHDPPRRGQDDFASMAEVVGRRFARMARVTDDEFDASFSSPPNLVVIDGGKGQLAAALKAMAEHDLPRVAVIALAKREEEVFVPGRPDPILLERGSAGLQLLQRIRDEAHRFALGFHRQRRARSSVDTIFAGLPGVGPARRRVLLRHFKTADALTGASREQLEAVPGLPPKVGRRIHEALHKTG